MSQVLVLFAVSLGGLADGGLLLAQRTEQGSLLIPGILVGLALVAVIGGGLWYRHRQLQQQHSHPALFHGLCQAHQLDRASQRLLVQVMRFHRLSQPARLFTEPQWLEPSGLGGPLAARAAEVTSLRSRLFAVAVVAPREESGANPAHA